MANSAFAGMLHMAGQVVHVTISEGVFHIDNDMYIAIGNYVVWQS